MDTSTNKRKGMKSMLNKAAVEIKITTEDPIYKAVSLLAKLPPQEQERISYRLEGYLDGYASASGKRQTGNKQPAKAAAY